MLLVLGAGMWGLGIGARTQQRSISICILFNGLESDRESIRRTMQEELRKKDKDAQVWLSRLQSCSNPSRVGPIFYPTPFFNLPPFAKHA
eukprot:14526571-Ditylum_brightwellii.AAC.1